ncbi:YbaK/EbsC family protein [Loigolactobacillus bifermentans]|uniref:YbaK/aminoacyl-tRNA synthetase-associated domain-containing protein n=1 Tax=Loigolactobacillus bifermentans DSM 20003 TaxID=1423726 RepID=A0A0R1H6S2_9LACO|nr:YbaK/EbsC family protein [Loigolactobacillus bifermentans]KRK39620.1 hypothetical protein FC07_GL002357 [Loigolactobacillus bifermentans DSM 20003]QGG60757.1 YbaK/EbsC family protein [Loigolactobacillus bifermentans]
MSLEQVTQYFKAQGIANQIVTFDESTATVEQAAAVLGVVPDQIAKTMAFQLKEKPIVIVTAGTAKVANAKFKAAFGQKAHMVARAALPTTIGHQAGGICPFALAPGVSVYFDTSLRGHDILYPAAGAPNAVIRLTLAELVQYAAPEKWIDVVKA